MKKSVRIIAVALVAVMLCLTFASCAKVSGTYTDATGLVTLEFKGSKLTMSAMGESEEYTFKIKDDKIIITDEDGDEEEASFEKDGKTIKIGGITYTKK